MAQYLVIKKKNNILELVASKVNLKRARLIASHPHDKYATYLIAEVVEHIIPSALNSEDNENREML